MRSQRAHPWLSVATALLITHSANATCPVTLSNPRMHENDTLSVILPPSGKFILKPGGAGFIATSDQGLGVKVGWIRKRIGELSISGRRLDAYAPPMRAVIAPTETATGFQPSSLIFPTPGCWEIAGKLADQILTFVVSVEKIGVGPSWRRDL